MGLLVALEVEVGVEALVAIWALEALDAAVHLKMFVQIRSLSKAEAAIWEVTNVRPLIRVDAQVVKEVVPLTEPLVALGVVALEDLYVPLRSRVLVGEDAVLLSVRHMLFYLHASKIKIFS